MSVRALAALAMVAILLAAATWSLWVLPRASWLPMPPAGRVVLAVSVALGSAGRGRLGVRRAARLLGLRLSRGPRFG